MAFKTEHLIVCVLLRLFAVLGVATVEGLIGVPFWPAIPAALGTVIVLHFVERDLRKEQDDL